MKETRLIYADGSSLGNPGPGGWGAIIAWKDKVIELGGGDPHTTNNKMELTAAIEALKKISSYQLPPTNYQLIIRTDSRYLVNGITKWAPGWEAAGWRGTNKKKILNKELWQKLLRLLEDKNVVWEHVHGHAGIPGNERVDAIATAFAEGRKPELSDSPLAKYPYDLFSVGETKRRPSKKKNTGKAYSYLSLVGGVIARHATWAECERRVKGVSGAKFKKTLSPEDERGILAAWGHAV